MDAVSDVQSSARDPDVVTACAYVLDALTTSRLRSLERQSRLKRAMGRPDRLFLRHGHPAEVVEHQVSGGRRLYSLGREGRRREAALLAKAAL